MRIPVYSGTAIIELADEARARHLAKAQNAQVVRRHRDKQMVQINLRDHGTDKPSAFPKGNPLRYSHDHETPANPRGVWTMKHLPNHTGGVFRAVVTDCLKAA